MDGRLDCGIARKIALLLCLFRSKFFIDWFLSIDGTNLGSVVEKAFFEEKTESLNNLEIISVSKLGEW